MARVPAGPHGPRRGGDGERKSRALSWVMAPGNHVESREEELHWGCRVPASHRWSHPLQPAASLQASLSRGSAAPRLPPCRRSPPRAARGYPRRRLLHLRRVSVRQGPELWGCPALRWDAQRTPHHRSLGRHLLMRRVVEMTLQRVEAAGVDAVLISSCLSNRPPARFLGLQQLEPEGSEVKTIEEEGGGRERN